MLAVGHAGLWPRYETWQPISGLLVLSLAIAMHWVLSAYYRRAFGSVGDRRQRNTLVLIVVALAGAFLVDVAVSPPVSVVGLAIAVWFFGAWREARRFRIHYAITAASLLLISLLPLLGMTTPERHFGIVLPAAFGLALIANGVVDHLLLRRLLPPVTRMGRAS